MVGIASDVLIAGAEHADIGIEHVTHVFESTGGRGVHVLDDVSLNVRPGEFVTLIGPSGCGKTTLLNMIAGFLEPAGGVVRLGGDPVRGVQTRKVAFMFARDNLLPWRTAGGNVRIALELRGEGRASKAEAEDLLRRVGLGGFENHYPGQLSHGMRQRVALARTLASESSTLLMDEPFGALDAQTRVIVQNEFARIWEQLNRTVLMVTHDLTEAIALSDRVLVMSGRPGRIKAEYEIDLPRPRVVFELLANRRFQELVAALWTELEKELVVQDETSEVRA